uniref:hypothetical protein n=1 Tax=Streptomyces europaeiscabiei TaxID=146819 RepID=UPI00131B5FAF
MSTLRDDLDRMRHLGNRAALLKELGRDADARAALARCLALRPDPLTTAEEAILAGHQGYVAELTDPRTALVFHRRSRGLAREAGSAVIEQAPCATPAVPTWSSVSPPEPCGASTRHCASWPPARPTGTRSGRRASAAPRPCGRS